MCTLTNIRMACHQLTEPEFDHPSDLVAWMGAMQAQDYTMSKWAIGLRVKSATLNQVNEALAKGEIVRTHILRPTWHYVAGKDLRWMLQLTSARVRKSVDSWVKASGPDISESQYNRCNDLIAAMLSGRRHLMREEIETELQHKGVKITDDRVRRYILRAETEGIICSGGDREGKPTYALFDEQVAFTSPVSREEALGRLAINYFRSHSPAMLKDFTWWSGLPVTEAKKALSLILDQLIRMQIGGQEFFTYTSYGERGEKGQMHFLPPFDEYLVSYKE